MKNIIHIIKTLAIALLLPALSVSSAETGGVGEELVLEQITVTGQKREDDAQKISVPLTVISNVDIEDRGITSLKDAADYFPNFIYGGNRSDSGTFNFRGLGYNVYTEKQPVIINVDGVPWDSRFGILTDFTNVEQIEFLRGPQGTLYGKNAMGGVLNITTKSPGDEVEGKAKVQFEERNGHSGSFQFSSPIIEDSFYYSVSGSYSKTDGYITDTTPGNDEKWDHEEQKHLSVKLLSKLTDSMKFTLMYNYADTDSGAAPIYYGKEFTYESEFHYQNSEMERQTTDLSGKLDYAGNSFDVVSITGYKHTTGNSKLFYEPSEYGNEMEVDTENISQEIRLTSKENESGTKWLIGAYTDKTSMEEIISFEMDLSAYGMGVVIDHWPFEIESESMAAFGEIKFPMISDRFFVVLGSRYETITKQMDYKHLQTDYETGASTGDYNYIYMTDNPTTYETQATWSTLLGKTGLEYVVSDDFLTYLTVSQGYMPGGFNYTTDKKDLAEFDEQKSLNTEIGFKSKLFNERILLNVNLFHTQYTDLQVLQNQFGTLDYWVDNAGKAHATGIEVDFNAKLTGELDLFGNLGILEAKYDDFTVQEETGEGSYDSKTMVNAPAYTLMFGIKYRSDSGLFALADYHQYGTTHYTKDNNSEFTRDTFGLLNLKAGYETSSGLEFYGYVRNATDEEYITEAFSGAYHIFSVGEPRTIGIVANYRF